jgi:hypothetical protein
MEVAATLVGSDSTLMPIFEDPRVSVRYSGRASSYEFPSLVRLQEYCAKVTDSGCGKLTII